ncbi:MAG: hypothetical protein CMO34_05125 [Verrucomicrobia bacterium]|nr:hypothetical protein [Verrucomicrobiota bacterium]
MSLCSCTSNINVVIKSENSAIVESEFPLGPKEKKKFTQSKLITILDTVNNKLKFKINSIDSLGNYLQGFPKGVIRFITDKDTLTVNSGNAINYRETNVLKSHLYLTIQSKNDINPIHFDKKFVKKIENNSIRITKTPNQLKDQKRKLLIKMIYQ